MENQNPRVLPLWEHSLTTLLEHDPTSDPGMALRQWVHFQGVHNILVTEVWHMAHFWVSYGRCTMPGSPMGRSEGWSRRWIG